MLVVPDTDATKHEQEMSNLYESLSEKDRGRYEIFLFVWIKKLTLLSVFLGRPIFVVL